MRGYARVKSMCPPYPLPCWVGSGRVWKAREWGKLDIVAKLVQSGITG